MTPLILVLVFIFIGIVACAMSCRDRPAEDLPAAIVADKLKEEPDNRPVCDDVKKLCHMIELGDYEYEYLTYGGGHYRFAMKTDLRASLRENDRCLFLSVYDETPPPPRHKWEYWIGNEKYTCNKAEDAAIEAALDGVRKARQDETVKAFREYKPVDRRKAKVKKARRAK